MSTVSEDLKNGTFHNVYLLYGEESYMRRYYRNRLKEALLDPSDDMNLNMYQGDRIDLLSLIEQANTLPFFSDHRLIIVEDGNLFKAEHAPLIGLIENMPPETILIINEEKADARSRLFKAIREKGCIQECKYFNDDGRKKWMLGWLLKEKKKIQIAAMDRLMLSVGTDLEGISHELEKLRDYVGERDVIEEKDVEAVCPLKAEDHVFWMIEAISQQNAVRTMRLYRDLLILREPPMRILAVLAGQVGRLLQIRDLRDQGFDQGEIASRTGMKDFTVRKSIGQAQKLTAGQMKTILEYCAKAQEDIRSGAMSDQLALETVLVQSCHLGTAQKGK